MHTLLQSIRQYFQTDKPIPLQQPNFNGNEKDYLLNTLESTFVSSVGPTVDEFERQISRYTRSPFAIATVNGTSALHVALIAAGVGTNDLVVTQSLTFVATCNAIRYCGADPVFVDVDKKTMGLAPDSLEDWFSSHCTIDKNGLTIEKKSKRKIRACIPMHTFGIPTRINETLDICQKWNVTAIEDAAESLGSLRNGQATGTFAPLGILSFNGNKIITTGGGGIVLAQSEKIAKRVKHLTTTAKVDNGLSMYHNEVGYNYRMPNLNAALGIAQLEQIDVFIARRRSLHNWYSNLLPKHNLTLVSEPDGCRANYWLVSALCENKNHRNELLKATHEEQIGTRPAWTPAHQLPMYKNCLQDSLFQTDYLADRLINLPS